MRILYVTEATGLSGGTAQIWLTTRELIRRGHQVAVACRRGAFGQSLEQAGIPVFPLRILQDYDVFSAFRLARIAQKYRADLLHAHHPQAHAIGLLANYFMRPVPLVVTRRVIYPIPKNPFSAFKYRSRKITRFIAVCRQTAQELTAGGVDPKKIVVIPSAVDLDRWEASRLKRSAQNGEGPFIVTMVGHYSAIKGHEIFLRAAAQVLKTAPQIKFRLVGRDTENLLELARDLGIAGHVEILGERSDIPEILAQTHLYVMPSLLEGIGTSLIEAQAAMVPVIASDVGGLPDVVENHETGLLVPPGDPHLLAEAILRAVQNTSELNRMAQKGYERVKKTFSLETVVDRLEKLYREAAKP